MIILKTTTGYGEGTTVRDRVEENVSKTLVKLIHYANKSQGHSDTLSAYDKNISILK